MICALCKVQRIAYTRLASAFDSNADEVLHCEESSG